jgi:alanine racemase
LQQFAAYYRSRFHFPVGLTSGKTIVKGTWSRFCGSRDNPLSIFAINEKHNLGVFLKQEFLPLMKWKN